MLMDIILLLLLIKIRQNYAQYSFGNECPSSNIKYDKVIGLRPVDEAFYKLLYKNKSSHGITRECLMQCENEQLCSNIILFYNNSECYEYNHGYQKTTLYSDDGTNIDYLIDPNAAFFVRTCLTVSSDCRQKLWPIERVPGSTLVTNSRKTLLGFYTRQECAQKCLNETEFICRSANFRVKGRSIDVLSHNVTDTLGFCSLNEDNRHTLPNSFRVSNYGDEYIENKCIDISSDKDYCSYEEYMNSIFIHTDEEHIVSSRKMCQKLCENQTSFNCYGYSLIKQDNNNNSASFICRLNSEDSQLLGPKLLVDKPNGQYFERARCLNLSVACTSTDMYIKYTPEGNFLGRIYMHGFSESKICNSNGKGNNSIILKIGIKNHDCGITEAISVGNLNRTLLAGFLIIQYNPLIQTQGDRYVKVGCLLDNDLNNFTQNVTLESSVQFNSSLPDRGSVVINNSTIRPVVNIVVVDQLTNLDVTDVQIGQEIQLRIEIEPADGPYDIWASNLLAMTEDGSQSIPLLDDMGCALRPSIFPPLTKRQTPTKRILYANFLAFKFPSSPIVKFSVIVHFCTLVCPPSNCTNGNRRKRDSLSSIDMRSTNVIKLGPTVNLENTTVNHNNNTMMPLEYVIIVRWDNITSEPLIIGDGKIVIAGYDIAHNQVCIDYSLLLGLLIFWFILQVIIFIGCIFIVRRYKKYYDIAYDQQSVSDYHQNFGFGWGNLNRRVHWADQNCPQCPHTIIE